MPGPNIELISTSLPDLLPMQGRSEGIHVSTIVNDLAIRRGLFEPSEINMTRLQLGCAMEDTIADRYEQHYPGRYIKLGELTKDGIHGTMDLWDNQLSEPNEIKLTWQSSKHIPTSDKFWYHWLQLGSYVFMSEANSGVLTRVHINGDYKQFDVHCRSWRRRWSKAELSNLWAMICRHRDLLLIERKNGY